jgi:hypothetical protein
MTIKSILSVAVIATVAGMAGCGGDSGSSGSGGSGGGSSFDACSIVTEADATAMFGNPAAKETGTTVADPHMLGECLWGFDDGSVSHLMEFRAWDSDAYYDAPADSQAFAIGDGGYTRTNPIAGVDIGWLQGGWTVSLSYGTAGATAPDPTAKLDDMKALAQKTSGLIKN